MRFLLALALGAAFAFGQAAPPPPPPAPVTPGGLLASVQNPLDVALASYCLSQIAAGATNWQFTAAGRTYNVDPVRQTGIAAAVAVAGALVAHKWPKLKFPLALALYAAGAYYGGVAYAQAQNHGVPNAIPTTNTPITGASIRWSR